MQIHLSKISNYFLKLAFSTLWGCRKNRQPCKKSTIFCKLNFIPKFSFANFLKKCNFCKLSLHCRLEPCQQPKGIFSAKSNRSENFGRSSHKAFKPLKQLFSSVKMRFPLADKSLRCFLQSTITTKSTFSTLWYLQK